MRAVAYCRVSTKEQVSNLSLATQEKVCREYAEREGYELVRVFVEEGESAKSAERKRLIEMLGFCRIVRPRIDAVIVHSLSRFSRDVLSHHSIRNTLLASGTTLLSATERLDNSPSGKLVETLIAGVAQFENDVKSQRTIEGMKEANRLGRWTWTASLGYINGRPRAGPSLLPDPDRADLVRRTFDLAAQGRYSKAELLRLVNSLGLRTRKGAKLTAQSLGPMLANPVYAGRLRASKWGDQYRGDWVPLVSEETFDLVQRLYRRQPRTRRLPVHPDFPLRRFVRCGSCDKPLTGSHSKGRTARYAYYHCPKCNRVRTSKANLETAFSELMEQLQLRPEYLKLFRAIVVDCWNTERDSARSLKRDVENRIAAIGVDIDTLEQAYLFRRSVDAPTYQRQLQRLRDERTAAQCELSDVRYDELEIEGLVVFAEYVLGNLSALWSAASVDDKAQLQDAMFPTGMVWDGESFGTAVTTSAFSWLRSISTDESCVASPSRTSQTGVREFAPKSATRAGVGRLVFGQFKRAA